MYPYGRKIAREICDFVPKGEREREIAYHLGEATFDFPTRGNDASLETLTRQGDYTVRAIFETQLGLITNQLTRNFPPFDDSRIRNRSNVEKNTFDRTNEKTREWKIRGVKFYRGESICQSAGQLPSPLIRIFITKYSESTFLYLHASDSFWETEISVKINNVRIYGALYSERGECNLINDNPNSEISFRESSFEKYSRKRKKEFAWPTDGLYIDIRARICP